MFIPKVWINFGIKDLYLSISWFRIELCIWYTIKNNLSTKGIYIIPYFGLYYLNKQFKEKWDFQFYWFKLGFRKFFGVREIYKKSLKELGYEFNSLKESLNL